MCHTFCVNLPNCLWLTHICHSNKSWDQAPNYLGVAKIPLETMVAYFYGSQEMASSTCPLTDQVTNLIYGKPIQKRTFNHVVRCHGSVYRAADRACNSDYFNIE